MDNLYVIKGQLQQVYAKYSKFIDKGVQFILALAAFYMINHDLGFMSLLSNPLITLGLAVICAFLPMIVTVLAAAILILVQMAAVSLGIMAVTAAVFVIMFVFYVRFSPKTALIILLTPLAFLFHIPYVIPVAFGLVGAPSSVVAIICGTIVYYMIDYVKTSASALESGGATAMISQLMTYLQQVFQNKEMIITIIAFVIVLFLVYQVRRMAISHAWKSASAAGAVVSIVIMAAGSAVLDVKISYPELILGNVAAVIVGLILELLFFAVDYSRTESVQYEDDEYYYYVKAVPKIVVAAPEKTVKRINRRTENQETEIINTDEIRRKSAEDGEARKEGEKKPGKRKAAGKPRSPRKKESQITGNMDQLLLTRSLQKELHLDEEERND
ncbi:hypothetical protein H9X90_07350 [Faecalicatena contorta]|uniref:hypothetical protein n=1 Tax=Faecalicatena contorta TaxID=39482 RepID=UPI001961BFF5|nr:hypothetical protein [Faecalicatena contorta]MBM6685019.1 hypothetical protein [Faecalicatena contorta]MBM6710547.1 hypothetical protein [Faecalicatena contorta]